MVCTRQVSAGLGVLGARGCCSPSPRMLYCSTRTLKTPLRMLKPPLKMLKPPPEDAEARSEDAAAQTPLPGRCQGLPQSRAEAAT